MIDTLFNMRAMKLCIVFVLLASVGGMFVWGQDAAKKNSRPKPVPNSDRQHYQANIRPFLAKYCFSCHGPEKQKAKLRLDTLDPDLVGGSDADMWQEVLDLINVSEMPPEDAAKHPGRKERQAFVDALTVSIRKAMEAILRNLRTDCNRESLPRDLGLSSTVYSRFREWRDAGVFQRMWKAGLLEYDELRTLFWHGRWYMKRR